jgi:hypothetical protein
MLYIGSLVLIASIVTAFLVASDRRDRRERVERAELLQRIQAPHAAVAEHHHRATVPVDPGSGLPMTDGEMAGMEGGIPDPDVERQRMIAWMEAVENGTVQLEDGVIQ